MAVKYTKSYLEKIESLFAESDYILRYEKGNFKSGYCILNDTSVLIDILKELNFNPKSFASKKNQEFLGELQQTTLKL